MSDLAFDVHPSVAMVQKWVEDLPAKTGRTLEEWAAMVRASRLKDRKERIAWLKEEHKLGTNSAWFIEDYTNNRATWDGDPKVYLRQAPLYVDGMFAKGKEWQRPIFEKLMAAARALGPDVKVCPCKTIVPFYRAHVFAQVMPATKTRLEFSVAIGGRKPTGKLRPNPRAKGNDRLTHQFVIESEKDVTAEVLKWMKVAYEADVE
jgi:hypothetical protein